MLKRISTNRFIVALQIAALSSITGIAMANPFSPGNEVLWEKEVEGVGASSVIEKPACDGGLAVKLVDDSVLVGHHLVKFSVKESRDGAFWIVQSDTMCSASNYDCISKDALLADPEVSATIQCWKYRGLTMSSDDSGEVQFDSDNPAEQRAIRQADAAASE